MYQVYTGMASDHINHQFLLDLRRDLDALSADVKELRAFVNHLDSQCQIYATGNSKDIGNIYNVISVIQDQLAPIEETIFPAVSQARDELNRIIVEGPREAEPDTGPAD
jgi:hypothetical protein